MELIYKDKSIKLVECKSFFMRLKGFMFTNNIDKAILFNKCNSIHTFFMRENIDVIMCDKNDQVLFYYANLGKNRIILPKRGVYKTIECPIHYFNIKVKDTIKIVN